MLSGNYFLLVHVRLVVAVLPSKNASTPSQFSFLVSFTRSLLPSPSSSSPTGCSGRPIGSRIHLRIMPIGVKPVPLDRCALLHTLPHFSNCPSPSLLSFPLSFRLRPQLPHSISSDFCLPQCLCQLPRTTLHGLRRLHRPPNPAIAGLFRSNIVLFLQGRMSLINLALVCSSLPFPHGKDILPPTIPLIAHNIFYFISLFDVI